MGPIDLAKTTIALTAYRASGTAKTLQSENKEKELVLPDAVKITISEEGKKLAAESYVKYSNLRIMRINNRNYH